MRFRTVELIITLALGILLAPLLAEAQQPKKIAKIGYLLPSTPAATAHLLEAFRQGMRELGYIEGKTVVLEIRYGEARFERLPELARELVGLKVDVIVTGTDVAIAAVKRETQTIPIVMGNSTDPVGTGFVASLVRPPVEMSQGLAVSLRSSVGSGWSCCGKSSPGSPAWPFSGIPISGALCLTTMKRRVRPVRWVCRFNPLKWSAPRTSIAPSQQSRKIARRR